MKRTEPKSIATIIDTALSASGGATRLAMQRASFMWSEIVGPGVNSYTTRRYVEGTELHVYITSATLKHELSFLRSRLVDQINAAIGSDTLTDLIIH